MKIAAKDRSKFVQLVKAAGQEVIDRAEDLIGEDFNFLEDFDIWLRFPDDEAPQIEVTRSHTVRRSFDVLLEDKNE